MASGLVIQEFTYCAALSLICYQFCKCVSKYPLCIGAYLRENHIQLVSFWIFILKGMHLGGKGGNSLYKGSLIPRIMIDRKKCVSVYFKILFL